MVIREQDRVRLISRGVHDWTLHSLIVTGVLKLRQKYFVIDGERVALGTDGISDFDALHPSKHNGRAQLYVQASVTGRRSIASKHPEKKLR
jgi:bifunctional non-homologous end joining protein LigD